MVPINIEISMFSSVGIFVDFSLLFSKSIFKIKLTFWYWVDTYGKLMPMMKQTNAKKNK